MTCAQVIVSEVEPCAFAKDALRVRQEDDSQTPNSKLQTQNFKLTMSKIQYMTQEGLDKLKEELNTLKTKGRKDMAEQIAEARAKGDLSENAEYDAAKEAQGHMEARIALLTDAVANARILDANSAAVTSVVILSTVELKNLKVDKVVKYTIVSEHEADLKSGKISVGSPIGKGLLGKTKGEKVDITTPGGVIKFQILSISR